jgi:hypothetical protein
MQAPGGPLFGGELGSLLDGRYRINTPVAEGILLRELRGTDVRDGSDVALWMPHRQVAPAYEDIDAEIASGHTEPGAAIGAELRGETRRSWPSGCRRIFDRGAAVAYIIGEPADAIGPRPSGNPHTRDVVAGWFRAVAGIVARNHQAGRWHGLLTCDDLSILEGKLVAGGFGFWVRADPEAIAAAICEPDAQQLRDLCAPEVAACAIGPAADLWALGRCTLALATGSGEGDSPAALRRRHPELAELVAGLMHEDPDARPGDLRLLAEAITRALQTPYRDEDQPAARPRSTRSGGASPVVPIFEPDGEDTEEAIYEPRSGLWSGASVSASIAQALAAQPQQRSLTSQTTETASPVTITDAITGPTTARAITGPTTPRSRPAQAGRVARSMSPTSPLSLPTPIVARAWSPLTTRSQLERATTTPIAAPTAAPIAAPTAAPIAAPIHVISMKEPELPGRPVPAPHALARPPAPKLALPRIRSLDSVLQASPRASPAALGTIAPPRGRTQPVQPARRWPVTLLVVLLALAALGLAAAAVVLGT